MAFEIGDTEMASAKRVLAACFFVVLAGFPSACGVRGQDDPPSDVNGSTTHSSSSAEVFPTVLSLVHSADAVLIGRLSAEGEPFVDSGGNDDLIRSGMGIRMRSYSFDVSDVLVGPPGLSSIDVGWMDNSQTTDTESLSVLRVGQELLIFVDRVDRSVAPGLPQDLDELWIPLSGDNGVFDIVDSNRAQPRSSAVTSLNRVDGGLGSGTSGKAAWSLSEIRGLLSRR